MSVICRYRSIDFKRARYELYDLRGAYFDVDRRGSRLFEAFMAKRSLYRTAATFSLAAHSQITIVRQPIFFNARTCSRSRAIVRVNFNSQNWKFVLGVVVNRQFLWRCQKQPCTNIAIRNAGNTISGLPGMVFTFLRKRTPSARSKFWTILSGAVSLPRIRDMLKLRCAGV
jgi:hypothetical protein